MAELADTPHQHQPAAAAANTVVVTLQDFDSICRFCLQRDVLLTAIFAERHHRHHQHHSESGGGVDAAAAADECDWSGMIVDLTGMKVRVLFNHAVVKVSLLL